MNNLELFIIGYGFIVLILWHFREKRSKVLTVGAIMILVSAVFVHLYLQGQRWQMYCFYMYVLILTGWVAYMFVINKRDRFGQPRIGKGIKRQRSTSRAHRGHRGLKFRTQLILPTILLGILPLLSLILVWIFAYNDVPMSGGPFLVGTTSFDIVDTQRKELYGDKKGEQRKIRVQAWYPANIGDDEEFIDFERENMDNGKSHISTDFLYLRKGKWLNDGISVAHAIPAFGGMPEFLLSYAARIDSNSYLEAPMLKQDNPYPVVVISHGWSGFRNLHTDIGELLASHGYIAISIDHSYGSMATVHDDGEVVRIDPMALPEGLEGEPFLVYARALVKTYSLDAKLVLDTLAYLNEGEMATTTLKVEKLFEGAMDLDLIGVLGHSTGGGGVTRLAMTDQRVKALVGYDPWVEPIEMTYLESGLQVPSVTLSSEQWQDGANEAYLKIIAMSPNTVTKMYQINGSNHQDFSMMYMFDTMGRVAGLTGELNGARGALIQQSYVLGFFNQELKGMDTNVHTLVNEFDEVVLLDLE